MKHWDKINELHRRFKQQNPDKDIYETTNHIMKHTKDYVIWLQYQVQVSDAEQSSGNCNISHVSGSDERWVCQKCNELVDGINVTFEEYHEGCGGKCV